MRPSFVFAAVIMSAVFMAAPSKAADTMRGHAPSSATSTLPACDDAKVLAEVEDQFEYGAPRVLAAPLAILEFSGMFEKAYFPQNNVGAPPENPIERRYCQAKALISDHQYRTVYYVVEYPMGFAGSNGYLGIFSPLRGWRAEGCVLGLDAWHVYGANCESLRRFQPEGRTYAYPDYVTK
ncbi:MAG: hypothetical protein V7704_14730 [Aurantimonas endophytica]|uniref:Uncharacterized protein n=1 Tax=Aurantimonas endophytica TaxID=1522175 RepID=A0A7W6H9G4_9HYPH|nr:hypothetical protein [Aurantimonas endophytica]MBB4001046.1 hypothetical protein [Aurantimonas endophytica]MCO6403298.1 hypothetical protein [Aurantimonas endophytica]